MRLARRQRGLWASGLSLGLVVMSVGGCGLRYGGSSQDKVLAELRGQNAALRERVAGLERERDELVVKLESRAASAAGTATSSGTDAELAAQVAAAMPAVVGVEIDGLSGLNPRDGRKVIVYVLPRDGRGRFTQVVGKLAVRVLVREGAPGGGSTPEREVGKVELSPAQLRDAYRSGFAGTNYMVEVDIGTAGQSVGNATLVMRAELTDLLAGRTHEAVRERAAIR